MCTLLSPPPRSPVENWLQNVVDSMKLALTLEFRKAIPAYDEMQSRCHWLYKFSVQNTIVVSRTFFTQARNRVQPWVVGSNTLADCVAGGKNVFCKP